ncbi:MAG: abortive infection family protein [Solirubrobacterales bacterium]
MPDLDWVEEKPEAWTALDAAQTLLGYAIAIAENGPDQVSGRDYRSAHKRMLRDSVARKAAPETLTRFTKPDLLWGHLRSVATGSGSWALRREAAHNLIDPVIDALHRQGTGPADDLVANAADRLDADSVREAWTDALERRETNPKGAITTARTLLESTIKTILEDRNVEYDDRDDLTDLYKAVRDELELAPGAYSEKAFKQILGGCNSVVVGLGSLRNKEGDAHGAGRRSYRPDARHAALAVNLAGSMALFLVETHEARD